MSQDRVTKKSFSLKTNVSRFRRVFARREKFAKQLAMGSALSSFKEQRKEKKELKRYLNHLLLVKSLI